MFFFLYSSTGPVYTPAPTAALLCRSANLSEVIRLRFRTVRMLSSIFLFLVICIVGLWLGRSPSRRLADRLDASDRPVAGVEQFPRRLTAWGGAGQL